MPTVLNLLVKVIMSANVKLDGLEMARSVVLTEIWMAGQTMIFPVRMRSVVWTTVWTHQILAKKIVMVTGLVMLVMMMLIMTVFLTLLTIVRWLQIQTNLIRILMEKICEEMHVTTVLIYQIWTRKTLTRMVEEMHVTTVLIYQIWTRKTLT